MLATMKFNKERMRASANGGFTNATDAADYLVNHGVPFRDAHGIVGLGPMGCRTGFYFLLRDNVSRLDALHLVQESFAFIRDFEGEIPGSRREECGNYKEHDLKGAKETAVDMLEVLKDWTPEKMEYEV